MVTFQENVTHAHGKMVKMIDKNTDKTLKIFASVRDAVRYLDVSNTTSIGEMCNGNPKK